MPGGTCDKTNTPAVSVTARKLSAETGDTNAPITGWRLTRSITLPRTRKEDCAATCTTTRQHTSHPHHLFFN